MRASGLWFSQAWRFLLTHFLRKQHTFLLMRMFLKLRKRGLCLCVGCVLQAQLHSSCGTQSTSQFYVVNFPLKIFQAQCMNILKHSHPTENQNEAKKIKIKNVPIVTTGSHSEKSTV